MQKVTAAKLTIFECYYCRAMWSSANDFRTLTSLLALNTLLSLTLESS